MTTIYKKFSEGYTHFYNISRWSFAIRLFKHYAWKLFFPLILVVLYAITLSLVTSNIVWIVFSLMIIFLVIPMALAFSYYCQALKPLTVCNTMLHSVGFSQGCLEIVLAENIKNSDSPEILAVRKFPAMNLLRWKVDSNGVEISIAGNNGGFIFIPYSSFRSEIQLQMFVDVVAKLKQ